MAERSASPPRRLSGRIWTAPSVWLVTVITIALIAYTIWVSFFPFDPDVEKVVSSVGILSANAVFIMLGLSLAAQRDADARMRRAWFFLALGGLCNFIAEALWFWYESFLHSEPFFTVADVFYLLYYPITLLGMLSFPFAPTTRHQRTTFWLDLGIVVTTSFMLFWYFRMASELLAAQVGLEILLAFAYPLADLLILSGLTALIQRDIEGVTRGALIFLGLATLSTLVMDSLFAYYQAHPDVEITVLLNIGWFSSVLGYCFAAQWQILFPPAKVVDGQASQSRQRRFLRLLLPYMAVVVGFLLMLLAMSRSAIMDIRLQGVLNGLLVLVGLVLLRQYVVLRENFQLYNEMRQMASTDSLTGLYNRHFFNETFELLLKRAEREGEPLTVLLMDVDGFKLINDVHGHLRGDEVLKTIAQLLAAQLRGSDLLARFGGDEFVAVLPNTDQSQALSVAARLRLAVTSHKLDSISLGISIGTAAFQPDLAPVQLLEMADSDLYRQKERTRPKRPALPPAQPPDTQNLQGENPT